MWRKWNAPWPEEKLRSQRNCLIHSDKYGAKPQPNADADAGWAGVQAQAG